MTIEYAFPQACRVDDIAESTGGMTLRDYFIAHAPITYQDAIEWLDCFGGEVVGPWPTQQVMACLADLRAAYADAMIVARNQPAQN